MTLAPIIAANHFGLGARPGELTDIGSDARGWLTQQLAGTRPLPEEFVSLPASARAFQIYVEVRQQAQQEKVSEDEMASRVGDGRKQLKKIYLEQAAARYRFAAGTSESFRERLVHFWANHFAVSVEKGPVLGLGAALEYEAIRPNLDRRFEDLLLAVEAHPAMILYLDNQQSLGPNSPVAVKRARSQNDRKLDINENLAREILELHTLGVNGGYKQSDVTTFALALTGWSVGNIRRQPPEPAGAFLFREKAHEPGAKTILGRRYAEAGVEQSRAVLKDLARQPSTAKHIAFKLARHFIADEPSPRAVERLAKVFIATDGDLPSLHRALIESPEAWERPVKFKTPHDYVLSTFRALDVVPDQPQKILAQLQRLGQRPYAPPSPAGWPDTASQWDGPDALLKRIEWATVMGKQVGAKVKPLDVGANVLGPALAERTRTAISRAESSAQGVALLLASPEFQRR